MKQFTAHGLGWHFRSALSRAVVLIGTLALAACGAAARHEVLTFFFTGVPPPGEPDVQAQSVKVATRTVRGNPRKRREFFQPARFFVHGPFGAGECERCHALTASKPFRTSARQAVSGTRSATTQKSIGPRLAAPIDELCISCHAGKGNDLAATRGLWQHGPAADGFCTACHSPHKAARRYLLLGKSSVDLCTTCHLAADIASTARHGSDPAADCVACHNPHVGKTALLLRSEFDERRIFDASPR